MAITRTDCIDALKKSSDISTTEAAQIVDDMLERKARLEADGKLVNGEEDLAAATREDFDAARMEAALRRRQEALTIKRRAQLEDFIAASKADGFSFMDALQAKLIGSTKRLFGARQSIDANRASIFDTFINQFESGVADIGSKYGLSKKEIFSLMAKDTEFRAQFAQERMDPGTVKDGKVRDLVDLYDRLSEEIRIRQNRAGANIARLEGRLPQSHDQLKMLDKSLGGKEAWVEFVEGGLDAERSFPGKTKAEVREILNNVFDTIVMNRERTFGEVEVPAVRTPRNMASSLGEHRVLHFKDASSYLKYMDKYGRSNLWEAVMGEIDGAARRLSLMETLGPNPEHMLRTLLENEKSSIRLAVEQGTLSAEAGKKQIDELTKAYSSGRYASGDLANWFAVLTGETLSPVDVGVAKAFGIARSFQSLGKLGAATLSAVADLFTKAMSMRTNGANFFEAHGMALTDVLRTFTPKDKRLLNDLGFYFELENGTLIHRFDQADTLPGFTTALLNKFFKYSGLTGWTEKQKATMAQWLSNILGDSNKLKYADLNPDVRAMLKYHGFGEQKWDIFRKHMVQEFGGKKYFNPALARNLTDEQIGGLLPEHLRGPVRKGYTPEQWKLARQAELTRMRTALETEARAFFADETKFAVIEPDAKVTATMTQGTRPGTAPGEAIRAIMQFKSFPIAFLQRTIGGRRWVRGSLQEGMRHGFNKGAIYDAVSRDVVGSVEYMLTSVAYGYLAMTLKDLSKNRTPRDPLKLETWLAAAMQSGGAGIYGDFLLGSSSRFGNSFLETLAGPLFGDVGNLVMAGSSALHGEFERAGDKTIRTLMGSMPYINLWYTKAAMDWLFLDGVKEWMSPGYKARMLRNMEKEFGQTELWPF